MFEVQGDEGDYSFNIRNVGSFDMKPDPIYNLKCATPTIDIVNGKLVFSCETPNVTYCYSVATPAVKEKAGNEVDPSSLSSKYTISVTARKSGYKDSEPATKEIDIRGLKGDVNDDGEVDIADAVKIVNFVVGKIPAMSRPAKEVSDEKIPQ
jgi:hypothetical protein